MPIASTPERRPESAPPPDTGAPPPATSRLVDDDHIVAHISAAVHDPFLEPWRQHRRQRWGAVEAVLTRAIEVHHDALRTLRAELGESGRAERGALAHHRPETGPISRYRSAVAQGALGPLWTALDTGHWGISLEGAIEAAATRARTLGSALPTKVRTPVTPTALRRYPGRVAFASIKRLIALAVPWIVWRRTSHDVPVARIARRHLERHVRRHHHRALVISQRRRAAWLSRMVRSWERWTRAALGQGDAHAGTAAAGEELLLAAQLLDTDLRALLSDAASASASELGQDTSELDAVLIGAVAVAGTFVASPDSASTPTYSDPATARAWDDWARRVARRLHVQKLLLDAGRSANQTTDDLVRGWANTMADIRALLSQVADAVENGASRAHELGSRDAGLSPSSVEKEGDRLAGEIAGSLRLMGEESTFVAALTSEADRAILELGSLCDSLPERLVIQDVPERDARARTPPGERRDVRVREAAVQAFDAMRMERIRGAILPLANAMDQARREAGELSEVVAYGYEATLGELTSQGAKDADQADHALHLLIGSLSRATDKLDVARDALHTGLQHASRVVAAEVDSGSSQLFARVSADRLVAQYLNLRALLARRVSRGGRRWRDAAALLGRGARLGVRAGLRHLGRLATLLGLRPPVRDAEELIDHTLADAAKCIRAHPVVYQRLFSFTSLTDDRLLAGREDELSAIQASWARWQDGGPGATVVVAPPGAGITSFMNALHGRLTDDGARSVRRTLRDRIVDEATLAPLLADWLGLDGASDLDDVARLVADWPERAPVNTVILEAAEHLHLRAPGGDALIARIGTLVTQTEGKIFWVISVTSSAWQLIKVRTGSSVADLRELVLQPLTAKSLQDAIMARHLRSGLPLQFAQPGRGRSALRSGAGSLTHLWRRDRRDHVIARTYFERLARASQGSIRLALFHWLRSADFHTIEGHLLVQPLEPVSPPLDVLSTTHSFALKAILDHGSLTVDEYAQVIRTPVAECLHMFRSLLGHHLVEPSRVAEENGPDISPESTEPDAPERSVRYRIPPLMIGAITSHLRSRNILH